MKTLKNILPIVLIAIALFLSIGTAFSARVDIVPSGVTTSTGNWLGTWQSNNPSDFLSSSTESGFVPTIGQYAGKEVVTFNPYVSKLNVYLGNLHSHSTSSDGVDTGAEVMTAYKNAGYDFNVITDHDVITEDPGVSGILFISGVEEDTDFGHIGRVHATVQSTSSVAQTVIDEAIADGSYVRVNHPARTGNFTADQLASIVGVHGIDIYDPQYPDGQTEYDAVMSLGRTYYADGGDDTHNVSSTSTTFVSRTRVFADSLTEPNIVDSLKRGNFYTTKVLEGGTEILLSNISVDGNIISITASTSSTFQWIADGSVSTTTATTTTATYTITGDEMYVRARVVNGNSIAWTNPFMVYRMGTSELDSTGVVDGKLFVNEGIQIGTVGSTTDAADKFLLINAMDVDEPYTTSYPYSRRGVDVNMTAVGDRNYPHSATLSVRATSSYSSSAAHYIVTNGVATGTLASIYGIRLRVYDKSGTAATTTLEEGLANTIYYTANGAITTLNGISSEFSGTGNGTVGNANVFYGKATMSGTGTTTNLAIFNGEQGSIGKPTTNLYGLKIGNLTSGTNSYSVYTGTAKSYFGGNVGIGTTTPSAYLHLGTSSSTQYALKFGTGSVGAYERSAGILTLVAGGAEQFELQSGGFTSWNSSGGAIRNETASATNPTLTPRSGDMDTGVGSSETGVVSLISDGVNVLNATSSEGGRIGISTTTPQATFDVNGSTILRATTTPMGRFLVPMGEISYFNLTGSSTTFVASSSDAISNMVLVAPPTSLTDDVYEFTSATSGILSYTGATTKMFHTAITMSLAPSGAQDTFVVGLAKNGSVIPESRVLQRVTTAGDTQAFSFHQMISLATNDQISVYIGNIPDTDSVVVKTLNIFAVGM